MSAELLTKELDDDSIVEPQITEGVTMTKPTIAILLAAVFFLSACEKASSPAPKPQPAAALPETLMLANAPSDAKPVEDAKSAAKVGEIVTISGKIGGMMKPFAEDRAVFTLVGPGIPSCARHARRHLHHSLGLLLRDQRGHRRPRRDDQRRG